MFQRVERSIGRSVFAAAVLAAIVLMCATASVAQVPTSKHVVLVIDENHSLDEVIPNMPWTVAQGYENGYAANYQSDSGGSLLNYLWLASGSCESSANCTLPSGTNNFNCNGNNCYYPGTTTSDPITDQNIFHLLNNDGISWKVYAQSYTAAGGTVTTPDNNNGTSYYRRHNGATWYSDILNNVDGSAGKIVDLSQLAIDLANGDLPRFMIIVPDGNHDAHDCPVGMSSCTEEQQLSAADSFLSGTLGPILATPDFQSGGTGLAVVTFDECGEGTDQGCGASVYTALIGPRVTPHIVSAVPYKHENALRTILESLGIKKYPGAAATASDMSDFFTIDGSAPEVVVSSPAGGASLSSPVTLDASAFPTAGHAISGWQVYVDSVSKYNAGTIDAIDPKIAMSSGTHTIVVRAWDTSGAYNSQTFTLTVAALTPTVSVTTPSNTANVGSPVNLQASASPSAGQTISKWSVYVDGVAVYNGGAATAINRNIALKMGSHIVMVRAWDTSGAYGTQTLTLTASSQPAVKVSMPALGLNVISPLNVQASAIPTSGHTITGWWIYLDGVGVYQDGAVDSINTNLKVSNGTHTMIVRAWDSSGAYGDQTLPLPVGTVAVNISSPANGAAVLSPATFTANAASANTVTSWEISIDSVPAYAQDFGNLVDASLSMQPGTHTVLVQAWDSTGAVGSQTLKVTIP